VCVLLLRSSLASGTVIQRSHPGVQKRRVARVTGIVARCSILDASFLAASSSVPYCRVSACIRHGASLQPAWSVLVTEKTSCRRCCERA
jgi:hypothetical protein